MVTVVKRTDQSEGAFRGLGDTIHETGERNRNRYETNADEAAIRRSLEKLGPNPSMRDQINAVTGVKTYNPDSKKAAINNLTNAHKIDIEAEIGREKNRIAALGKKGQSDQDVLKQNYINYGYPEYLADILANPDVEKSVKQQIAAEHKDLVGRGLRTPVIPEPNQAESSVPQPSPKTPEATPEASAPPGEEVKTPIEAVEAEIPSPPKEEEWPEIPPPAETTYKEKENWRTNNQKENNKLLQATKEKTKSHTNAMIRYNRLTNLNNSHKLPEGVGSLIINPENGETYPVAQLAGLVNKETQDFVKTMNDFLIDAKNYFGSRVTNFDVSAFKSRLPTLLNSEEGRRLIIEQMKLMEELQTVHDKELENGLKHYGRNASYSDIQKVVDDKTSKREAAIIDKINNLDKASDYMDLMANDPKFKGTTLMQNPKTGKFKAFNPTDAKEAKARGWTQW